MGILQTLGANTKSKFKTIISSYAESKLSSITNGQVNLNLSDGSGGASYATDMKERMAQIEWSRGFSWDVYLSPAPPSPFNETAYGLPVVEVQSDYTMASHPNTLSFANTTYSFPWGREIFSIKLVMMDDEKGTMEQYFEDWYNQVYPWNAQGGYTQYLDESVRELKLTKLTSTKREVFSREYLVYPQSSVTAFNNSTGNVRTFTIDLMVAGYLGKTNYKSFYRGGEEGTLSGGGITSNPKWGDETAYA